MGERKTEWAANSRQIHAWREWRGRDGRPWGFRALCGATSRYDFGWSLDVTVPGSLDAAKRFHLGIRPVCGRCRDLAPEPDDIESP